MKAFAYQITISDGVLGHIHGEHYDINEVYIPKYNIWINEQGIWKGDKDTTRLKRVKNKKEIEIPDHLAQSCVTAMFTKDKAIEFMKSQFDKEGVRDN